MELTEATPATSNRLRRIAPLLIVLVALIPYTWVAYKNADLPQFGKYQDDGLLFIGAKSLHDSGSYRITSFPGKPFQTKYSPLYAALLSLVWSVDAKFPENLGMVSALQWLLFVGFLATAFGLFRSTGFARWKSALMVGFLATSPWLIYWSLLPIADVMLALTVTGVFLLLEKYRDHPRWWWAISCLGVAACLTKVAGVLIVPAIWAGGWRRPQWKRSLILTVPMSMAFIGWIGWTALYRTPGHNSVLWYYTDYVSFDLKNGGLAALPHIVQANLGSFVETLGNSFLFNLADTLVGRFLSVLVLAAWISGVRRFVKRTGTIEYPVFSGLLALLLLVWLASPNIRLLGPALALVAMGLCAEAEHIYALLQSASRSLKTSDRLAAGILGTCLAMGCIVAMGLNVKFIVREIPLLLDNDRAALVRDRATFDWCKRTLPASSVLLAKNDTYLFLSTGLKAVRPVPSSIAFYQQDKEAELENFTHLHQLLDYFGITHILITPDGFDFDPNQNESIRTILLQDPRLKPIYSNGDSTVLEVQRDFALK